MKEIVLKLYEFDELSKDSQERIIERERWNIMDCCMDELGVNSESEFYFVKEMKGGETQIDSVVQNTMRYSYRKEGDLIPAYMSHELGEILPSMINVSKSKIWDDWLQLTQYFPNKDSEYYETAYVRYNAYDSQTEVYSGFGDTEVESRAMLLIDLLDKKVLTLSDLNLN